MSENKTIVMDLDKTLTQGGSEGYEEELPRLDVVDTLRNYKNLGFRIVIYTARNMRSYKGNVGLINVHTLPKIIEWLEKHGVPYDEIFVGKPWCGKDGFYVDDRAIRPSEFVNLSYSEIVKLIEAE
ncbi:capsule biosynthesis phosphatase [Candidatus Pantoea symbiotica]|jgi:capsule biosynthesis phosphatase|uniref:Capsule biosynthesis phosphatase n=1 Tax=Candidatus Pantoea symbiotica TaxID=1884370 RepID=A0A1I3WWE9_9GAMM|nr:MULTISPECIES: HAD-IIIC family phosphatase [Pantoea]KAJ9432539.1 HAD-IIIC family phosphatase [Pantoea sp. YR343]SFK11825.1 capsule biosynthesis phosphatase [Pantoea symbiotica]SFU75950.1 capsule biosynthesis phosphatase [Pantoea sp. YR525]